MPSSRRRFVTAGAGLLAGVSGCVEGQRLDGPTPRFDWWEPAPNDWPLARRDVGNTAANPHARPPTGDPGERWSLDAPGPVRGMVLSRGTLFVSGAGGRLAAGDPVDEAGGVVAVDVETGEERWRAEAPSGPLAVRDRSLYALGRSGDLAALDVETGERRWRVDATGDRRGAALALSADEVLCGFARRGLRAFDPETGEENWRLDAGSRPAVADGRLYVGGGGAVAAYEPREGANVVGGDGPVEAWRVGGPRRADGPVRHGDALYVGRAVGEERDAPAAYDPDDGAERWRGPFGGGSVTAPAVDGDLGVVAVGAGEAGGAPSLAALDLADGGVRWRVELDGRPRPPVLAGDLAFVAARDLRAYDAETGEERWRRELRGPARAVVAAADAVYAATRNGRVRAFE